MTKERRLAIQMWEEISAHMKNAKRIDLLSPDYICKLIRGFVREHQLDWLCDSWFCQYARYRDGIHGIGCQRCPISDRRRDTMDGYTSGCSHNVYYKVLYGKTLKIRREACDEIVRVLKGEKKK